MTGVFILLVFLAPPQQRSVLKIADIQTVTDKLLDSGQIESKRAVIEYQPMKEGGVLSINHPALTTRQGFFDDPELSALVDCVRLNICAGEYKRLFKVCPEFSEYFLASDAAIEKILDAVNNSRPGAKDASEVASDQSEKLHKVFDESFRKFNLARGMAPPPTIMSYSTVTVSVDLVTKPPGGKISLVTALEYELAKMKGRDPNLLFAKWRVTTNPVNLGGSYYYRVEWQDGKFVQGDCTKFDKTGKYTLP